jgi:hypothetical protein
VEALVKVMASGSVAGVAKRACRRGWSRSVMRPPSAKLCCHPLQRNAATFGDHQGCESIIHAGGVRCRGCGSVRTMSGSNSGE